MNRVILTTLMLAISSSLVAGSAVSSDSGARPAIIAKAVGHAPQSRMEAMQATDAAVAAALIGAISEQFDERNIEVRLDRVDSAPADFIQRDITGSGRLMIGGDEAWIPFQFSALYDTSDASVGYPSLVLGGDAPGTVLADDNRVSQQLRSEIDRRMSREFRQQDVQVALDEVRVIPAGKRYLQLQANGTADFGAEGTTPAGIQALYDPRTGQWLRVDYELGATANRDVESTIRPSKAVASR